MEKNVIEKLKQDLKIAVEKKDYAKMQEICTVLDLDYGEYNYRYFGNGLTGFPSIDQVWSKYYREGAFEKANDIPEGKTVWDVIEEKLEEYSGVPAIEYFKTVISREDFAKEVYKWARAFRAMGIEEGEVVPFYGPGFPDIYAMALGLNMIGAASYFLKLKIDPKSLAVETKDAKIAVVYDGMWPLVGYEFSKPRFKKILVATTSDALPSPKKQILSFKAAIDARKQKFKIPNDPKYVSLDKVKAIADFYTGDVKVPFKPERPTFITSSSGTTVNGIVKGTMATNESTISQFYMGHYSDIQYYPGDRCLCHFPPTASTALNMLFLVALFKGETVVLDPRVSEKDFYNQLTKLNINMTISTGKAWEAFFNRVAAEMEAGKKFDFHYAKGWTVGGEGTDVKKMLKWYEIMRKAHAEHMLYSGYGLSELFSAAAAEVETARYDFSKSIMSVGVPYAGMTMGVYDEDGNELPYNTRGELRIKSKSAMKGYYNKPELTEKIKQDDQIITGDMGEIDENGFIYVWGRMSDSIKVPGTGDDLFLFDVANKIKEDDTIDDAVVLAMPTEDNEYNLVAHIVWNKDVADDEFKAANIEMLNDMLADYLPDGVTLNTYAEHETMLPYSPTTLKTDKNGMAAQKNGYVQLIDGKLRKVEFVPSDNVKYKISVLPEEKVLTR